MEGREQNPLTPLKSVRLTDSDKQQLWEQITQTVQDDRASLPTESQGRKWWWMSAPFLTVAAVVLVGYANPQLLRIGKTFDLLRLKMFSPPQISEGVSLGYGEKVNQSATSHGITLKIGNVYADPTELEFDMVESFASGQKVRPVIRDGDLMLNINGRRRLTGFSGGDFVPVSGGQYAGVVYFPVMNDQPYTLLPSSFTLHVGIQQIGSVRGNWSFKFPVSLGKLQSDTTQLDPNVKTSNDGYEIRIMNVTLSPVQTIILGRMTIPATGSVPDRMMIIDNHGQVIGGGIENERVLQTTKSEKTVQLVITGGAPSRGAAELSITPMRDFSSTTVSLQGEYPKRVLVQPGLWANVTGIDFSAKHTIVNLTMDQAKYHRLNTYLGHSIAAQFFLVTKLGSRGSESVGSQTVTFVGPHSNNARIVFGRVDSNESWGLQKSYSLPQPGLEIHVPLK